MKKIKLLPYFLCCGSFRSRRWISDDCGDDEEGGEAKAEAEAEAEAEGASQHNGNDWGSPDQKDVYIVMKRLPASRFLSDLV